MTLDFISFMLGAIICGVVIFLVKILWRTEKE